ncbi:SRPBCC family protein [Bowmanella yangjiangensis]|uniref:SRPBCC domain-containing protein n=1 Tax=Bowmanella yangjiangensis TaxID=2811230 RepID=A0ABS3CUP5_9ALTE|nr:SRPBCC domain-containing protein [Bowmanella yangjiangensis]MBN7820151.1 SRPBCC domain-containing protein [Bowmanella yangjiangensis]
MADHGFVLENRVQVNSTTEKTWQALTQDVSKWWPEDHTWWGKSANLSIEPQAGGCFCEKDGGKQAMHMQVTFVEPGKLLRMSGGLGPLQGMGLYGALDWTLQANEQGTEIILTYKVHGFSPEGFAELAPIVDYVQGLQLAGLADHLNAPSH